MAALLVLAAAPLGAQWRNIPSSVPNGPDGKPNMAAPVPKTANGRPDLSGIYQSDRKYFLNLAAYLSAALTTLGDPTYFTQDIIDYYTANASALLTKRQSNLGFILAKRP
jgi:hypothetical protein